MPRHYATLQELKTGMNFPANDKSKDEVMQICLDAAAAVIDRICNRPDGFVASVASARVFHGSGKDYVFANEFIAVSLVQVRSSSSTPWEALTGWFPFAGDPRRPSDRIPYAGVIRESGIFPVHRFFSIQITAEWGYAESVPDQIKQATILQAARWFKRSETAWADATAGGELGVLLYRKAMDADLENILKKGRLIRPRA